MRDVLWEDELPNCELCRRYLGRTTPAPFLAPVNFGGTANLCEDHLGVVPEGAEVRRRSGKSHYSLGVTTASDYEPTMG